jgi:hypothetical protein
VEPSLVEKLNNLMKHEASAISAANRNRNLGPNIFGLLALVLAALSLPASIWSNQRR